MKRLMKRSFSVLMAALLFAGALTPALGAVDGITHIVDIYANGSPVTQRIVLKEGESLQLTATLVDCSMPEGGYFYWESETPILASVDQSGLLRAHDSSKGAVLRLWIDNDIRTIPVVGNTVAAAIEALFDGMDVDTMDAEGILDVVENGVSVLPGDIADSLVEKLRTKLNELDTGITVILYSADDVELARDEVRVAVNKSDAATADFFPNGTTITNKAQVPATVEVGYSIQLQAVTTPMRLHMGVNWSVKSGGDYATITPEGLATFTGVGEATLMASPDVKGFMDNVLKYADLVGEQDPEALAGTLASILVNVLGLPVSTTVAKYVLWGLLALAGTDNLINWTEGAITTVANYLLKLNTNDTVTVKVVQDIPVTSFSIAGTATVKEGETSQLGIADLRPKGATTQGIVWQSANPAYVKVDRDSGLLTGRDALSNTGSKSTTVTATLDGITMSKGVTVTGKPHTAAEDIEITGPAFATIGQLAQMVAVTYPSRILATITWGLLADDGETEMFATATTSAENSIARLNKNGVLTPLDGGSITVIAKTSDTVKTYFKVFVGTLVTGLAIAEAPNVAVHVSTSQSYNNASTTLHAVFTPADATNKKVIWTSSNGDIDVDENGVVSPNKNSKGWTLITATSQDGGFTDTCVVSFANYPVTGISIDKTDITLTPGATSKITETITPSGFIGIADASIKDVFWSSSNPAVATVSGGTVTAVAVGDATITALTLDGFKSATCSVKVRANKAALNSMISLVENAGLNPEDFPAEDFAAFTQALEEAYYVQNDTYATQAQVDSATQFLANNFNALSQYTPLQGVTLTFEGAPAPEYKTYKVGTVANYANQSLQFSCTLTPADADYKSVTWISSNPAMNVDGTGKCSPAANDPTWSVITVRAEDHLGNVFTDSVNVAFARVLATGISLDTTTINNALIHNTKQLTATITPTGTLGVGQASVLAVEWISTNPAAASVNDSGLVTFLAPGSTTIIARTRDGGFTATCAVNVIINKTQLEAAINTVTNANLDSTRYTPVTWDALSAAMTRAQQVFGDPNAVQADVDSATQQLNTAYAGLKTYIYFNSVSIFNGEADAGGFVSVEVPLTTAYTNKTLSLSARLSPLDSYYESIIWSSDSATVSVDQNGVCRPTANNACYAIITVTATSYYGRTATDSVYVAFANNTATRVDVSPAAINASIGSAPQTITSSVKHVGALSTVNASLQNVIWSSSNPESIPVTQNGQVSFLNSGSADIRATSVDGGVYGVCHVVVSGDKTALAEAIDYIDSLNINVQDYEYETSTAFSAAYAHAVEVYEGDSWTQEQIDAATAGLYSAYEALQPYIHMTELTILRNGAPAPSHISVKVELWQQYKNQSVQLAYSFAPANAMYTSIVWSSNDSSITVDQTGKCSPSAAAAGGALITLTATDHFGNKLTDTVFVSFSNYPVTGMTIDKTSLSATVGDGPVTITSSFTPTGAQGARVKKTYWTSSDPSVATVGQDGVVTYIDAGQCVITASSYDGGFDKTCSVTVYANKIALINAISAISGFGLDPEMYTPDSWANLQAALADAIAVRDTVFAKQGEVDAAKVALLNAFDSLVAYVALNAVQITFNGELTNGFVTKDVPLASTYQSQSIQLGYALFPVDATCTSFTWSSDSSSISVDQNGLCRPTANNACTAVITVTATDYKNNVRTGSVRVCFANYPVTGVTVSPASIDNAVNGTTATLTAAVAPAGTLGVGAANFKTVSWSSSDDSIATVTSDGVVTFHNTGSVGITATTLDGGFTATCEIMVRADKTALLAAINQLSGYTQTDYTPASWQAMTAVYEAADAVYNNADATQAEVAQAAANLTAAYEALVPYVYIESADIAVGGVNQNGSVVVTVASGTAFTNASVALGILTNPGNAMYQGVTWSSNSPDIIVNQFGLAKPTVNRACYATVTARVTDHFGNVYEAVASVVFCRVKVASITINPSVINANINSGDVQLTATVTGEGGATPDFATVVWSSSNPLVAAVDENGLVTIGIGGVAVITARVLSGEKFATCTVTVKVDKTQLFAIIDAVNRAEYNPLDFTIESFAALTSALLTAKTVYYNPNADQNEVDAATAALTAARDGLVDYHRLTNLEITYGSSPAPSHVSYKVPLTTSYKNCNIQLGVSVAPSMADYENLAWHSSSSSVIVDATGKCTPSENKASTAVITITANDIFGNVYSDTVTVAFANYQVTSVSLNTNTLTFFYGDAPATLTPTIEPKGVLGVGSASVKTVTWVSSNPDVAAVNASGAVTPTGAGTAVITCITDDGGKTATCSVTVTGPRIIPAAGSPAVVNDADRIITGIPEGATDIGSLLTTPYGEIVVTPTANGNGTGTQVDLVYNGSVIDSYTVVVYGDADGDGYVNAGDALLATLADNYLLDLDELQARALDVNGDGDVNAADADLLVLAGLFLYTIDQTNPYG